LFGLLKTHLGGILFADDEEFGTVVGVTETTFRRYAILWVLTHW
jgi:hypothetical protein